MSYPRETDDFQSVTVMADGVQVVTNVSFSIVPDGSRPGTFTAATMLSGKTCVEIVSLSPGRYRVFAKAVSPPETPVIDCGLIVIT